MYVANTAAKINTLINQQPVRSFPPIKEFCNCSGHFLHVMFTMNKLYLSGVGANTIALRIFLYFQLCCGNRYRSLLSISLTNLLLLSFIGVFFYMGGLG